MAAPLLAGLARVGSGLGRAAATGARSAAKSGAKKLATKKVKSFAKDKVKGKLSKKSAILSSKGDQTEKNITKTSGESGEVTPTLTGTSNKITIKKAKSSKSQVEQLKINVTNIHSFLVKSNSQYSKQQSSTKRSERIQESKRKLGKEEKGLKKKLPKEKSISNLKEAVASTGSIFDRILNFAGLVIAGIAVNALPAIINKVKEVVDSVVNFLTPIQSGFNVLMSFFNKDMDQNQLDVDKKRFDDGIQNITGKDGLIDKIKEKLGPFGGLVDILRPAIDKIRESLGLKKASQKIKLERRDGKEGFVNVETGEFIQRQWTSAERKKHDGLSPSKDPNRPDTVDDDKPDIPLEMKAGHYYFPLPSGQFSGESGQYYGAGRSYGGHAGIDLTESPPFGQHPNIDVVAMVGGKVLSEKYLGGKKYMSGMMIQGTDGYDQRYLHMTPMVNPGDNVKAGQKIGELVDMTYVTGNVDETHLHFEVYKRGKGGHLSPHKVYPKFFGTPLSAPRSLDTREKAQGGRMFESIRDAKRLQSLNQPMDDEGTTTIAIQQVNTIQTAYVPMPIPMRQRSSQSSSPSQLPGIWRV